MLNIEPYRMKRSLIWAEESNEVKLILWFQPHFVE